LTPSQENQIEHKGTESSGSVSGTNINQYINNTENIDLILSQALAEVKN